MIYTWKCNECNRKGATNMKPPHNPMVCLFCGEDLVIEVFSDVFMQY